MFPTPAGDEIGWRWQIATDSKDVRGEKLTGPAKVVPGKRDVVRVELAVGTASREAAESTQEVHGAILSRQERLGERGDAGL